MASANLRWTADTAEAIAKTEALKRVVSSVGGSSTTNAIKNLASNWKLLVPAAAAAGVAVLAFTGNLAALAPALPLLAVALTGLIAPFTALAALVVGFIPPVTLLVGLLGGLGAAFAYVAAQSFTNKGSMQDQKDALLALHVAQQTYNTDLAKYGKNATQTENALLALHKAQDTFDKAQQGAALGAVNLDEKFHKLIATLSKDFAPEIIFLARSLGNALVYLNKIASLPLAKAFSNLSTTGVAGIQKFLDKVGKIVAKPIRLAFEVAFGKSDTLRKALIDDWNDIMVFFTGKHGVLLPVEKWFGKQDFTATGYRWASELANAMVKVLGMALGKALSSQGGKMILGSAGIGALIGAFTPLGPVLGGILGAGIGISFGIILNHYWPKIRQAGIDAFNDIGKLAKQALGATLWNDIISLASSFWDTLKAVGGFLRDDVWPIVKKVWGALGGWHTVGVAVAIILRIIVGSFVAVALSVRTVYNWLRRIWDAASQFARIVAGAVATAVQTVADIVGTIWGLVKRAAKAVSGGFASAWGAVKSAAQAVATIVSDIAGAIQTAVGYADRLASALSSSAPGNIPQKLHPGAHALGGIARAGQVSLVGEKGPELRVEPSDARYIPADQTRQMFAGLGEMHLHVHIEGGTYIGVPSDKVGKALAAVTAPHLARLSARRA